MPFSATFTENAHHSIAAVVNDDDPEALTLWARHDYGYWSYLGTMLSGGTALRTTITPSDIASLADQLYILDEAWDDYVETLPS